LIKENEQIVTKSSIIPRKGWEKSFVEMAKNGDDKLIFDDIFEDDDFNE
jgi:antitoxin MazE